MGHRKGVTPDLIWGFLAQHMYNMRLRDRPHSGYQDLYSMLVSDTPYVATPPAPLPVLGLPNSASAAPASQSQQQPKKDYFVVTSNVDGLFRTAGFDPHYNRMYTPQGEMQYLQCMSACSASKQSKSGGVIESTAISAALRPKINPVSGKLSDPNLVPKCQFCGSMVCLVVSCVVCSFCFRIVRSMHELFAVCCLVTETTDVHERTRWRLVHSLSLLSSKSCAHRFHPLPHYCRP